MAGVPSESERNREVVDLNGKLAVNVAEQQENDALTLALKILKAAPIQDSFKTVTESGLATTYDYLPQRNAALHALETFDALDEYTRKVKAYYKEDTGNVIYDMLMAECLLRQNPAAATPFLEKAHALDPDNPVVAGSLATRYSAEGADASLLTLLDSILQENLPIPPELRIDVVGVYARANQLNRLTTLFANNLKNEDTPSPSGGGDQRLAYS